MVELLYTDQVGGQRTITRFALVPAADSWVASVIRHWYLDWQGPRPETEVLAARDAVLRDQEATERRGAARSEVASPAETDGSAFAPDG
jgi:hypothetical protein